MADPDIIDSSVSTTKKAPQPSGAALPEIQIGKPFKSDIKISQIKIDERDSRNQKNLPVKAGSRIVILGKNLNLFDAVSLRHGFDDAKTPEKMSFSGNTIVFSIPENFFENSLLGGGVLQVEFKSLFKPSLNCRLYNKLIYKSKKQIEQDGKNSSGRGGVGAKTGRLGQNGSSSRGLAGIATAAVGDAFRAVSSVAQGSGQKAPPKKSPENVPKDTASESPSKNTEADLDDEDFLGEENAGATEENLELDEENEDNEQIDALANEAVSEELASESSEVSLQESRQQNLPDVTGDNIQTQEAIQVSGSVEAPPQAVVSQLGSTGAGEARDVQVSGGQEQAVEVPAQQNGSPQPIIQESGKVESQVSGGAQVDALVSEVASAGQKTTVETSVQGPEEVSASAEAKVESKIDIDGKVESSINVKPDSSANMQAETGGQQIPPQTVKAPAVGSGGSARASAAGGGAVSAQPKQAGSVGGEAKTAQAASSSGAASVSASQAGTQLSQTEAKADAGENLSGIGKIGKSEELPASSQIGLPRKPLDAAGAQEEKLKQEEAPEIPPEIARGLANLRDNDRALEQQAKAANLPIGRESLSPGPKIPSLGRGGPDIRAEADNKPGESDADLLNKGRQNIASEILQEDKDRAVGSAARRAGPEIQPPALEQPRPEETNIPKDTEDKGADQNRKEPQPSEEEEQDLGLPEQRPPLPQAEPLTLRGFFGGPKKAGSGGFFPSLFGKLGKLGKTEKLAGTAASLGSKAIKGEAVAAAGGVTLPFLFLILAGLAVGGFFFIVVVYGACNYPSKGPLSIMSLRGNGKICDNSNNNGIGKVIHNKLDSAPETKPSPIPAGPISSAKWNDAIDASVKKYPPVDACILRVVVQKESRGKENIIGCDCAYNGQLAYCPRGKQSNVYYEGFPFNWDQCSYGIGLTQWTIFQSTFASVPATDRNGFKRWINAQIPSRTPFGDKFYTVSDFLNPQISLDLTADNFSRNLKRNGGDVKLAFDAYVGKSSSQEQFVKERMALYNTCKAQK